MNVQLSRWYESSRARVGHKLGACPRCMRTSLAIAIAAWIAYGVARAVSGEPLLHLAALVVAGAFTILLLAHIGAFYVRATRHWRAGTFLTSTDAGGPQEHSRRRFMVTSAALLGGALLAPLSRVIASPVLASSSPPVPCDCQAPNPKEPKTPCPSCRCRTAAPPKQPTDRCSKNENQGVIMETTAKGACAGTLKNCGGDCTRTFTWRCEPVAKKSNAFHWKNIKESDSCPTTGSPQDETTKSTGKCHGKGCKEQNVECGKETTWTCDPHASEGNDPKGRWTGTTVDKPPCPVS